jgi:DNA-binding IclR family transcriptional regulator
VPSSPPTQRVIQILNVMAHDPHEPLSLSEIARRLRLSTSTCQLILTSLADAGFVVRSSRDKSYTLGPALIHLGDAARSLTPVLRVVEQELGRLHEEVGFGCCAAVVRDEMLAVVARVGGADSFPVPAMAEGTWPFAAPIGATSVAWCSTEEIEAWLARSPRRDDAEYRKRLPVLLASIRDRGYAVWSFESTKQIADGQLQDVVDALSGNTHSEALLRQLVQNLAYSGTEGYPPSALRGRRRLPVGLVTAPVWRRSQDSAVEISVHVYDEAMPVAAITALGARVADVATRVAAAFGEG